MNVAVKPIAELGELLDGKKNVAVLACKLCLKEFSEDRSEELSEIKTALEASGKKITDIRELDFMCNRTFTEKVVGELDLGKIDAVVSSSCGVGTQVLASLIDKPVISGVDTFGGGLYEGFHPADSKQCRACGQCVLNYTAGICPVAYCAKSLLNGPCGGAKEGKCEVDSEKDCIWLKIHERLKKQGRVDLMRGDIRLRDYNNPTFAEIISLKTEAANRRDMNFYGGLYPLEMKEETEKKPIEMAPVPDILVIPLSQHIGAPNDPVVKVGDTVKMGQVIGKTDAYVSSPIHSPVSGKVIAIEPRPHPVMPNDVPAIVIENDKKDTTDESCVPKGDIEKLTPEQIIEIVRDKGLVGMGGAMFPTHVKIKPTKPLDLLILNGCECEPYLTADHRMMLEHTEEIVRGMRLIAKASGVDKCIIAVEDNKPDAAEALRAFAGDGVSVEVLKTKYPQGAERMLVYRLTGRTVPRGGLPLDVGVVVSNVGTAYAIYDAVANGMPLIKRAITISGDGVKKPGNYMVRIGTPFSDLLKNYIETQPGDLIGKKMIKMGGRMMGIRQSSLDGSVVKGTSGITIYPLPDIAIDESRQCIRCGRCLSVCPMELNPHLLWYYTNKKDAGSLQKLGAQDCIECGCCEYICSAKLPLVSLFKDAKLIVREKIAG